MKRQTNERRDTINNTSTNKEIAVKVSQKRKDEECGAALARLAGNHNHIIEQHRKLYKDGEAKIEEKDAELISRFKRALLIENEFEVKKKKALLAKT